MNLLMRYFSSRYLSRWIILLFDMSILAPAYFLAYLLRFNFDFGSMLRSVHIFHLMLILPVFLFSFRTFKTYSGILRHSTTSDINRILSATTLSAVLIINFVFISRVLNFPELENLSFAVIIIMNLLVSAIIIFSRLTARFIFHRAGKKMENRRNIVIYGTGDLGMITLNALLADRSSNIYITGFIDDNKTLANRYLYDVPIYPAITLTQLIERKKVSELIFALEDSKAAVEKKREVMDICLNNYVEVKEVPPISSWINGELQAKYIRKINIIDLLGREAISLDRKRIEEGLRNSVVLVTGAAGSIGSEIVQQLISFRVKQVLLLDKAESDLFNLQQDITARLNHSQFEAIICDVTNLTRLREIFRKYRPDIVYHAAAYKHVPLMEEFPGEAIRTNVGGTKNVADLSIDFGVKKFVLISTDKAVNPSNVMGATKRICEIYIQSLAQSGKYNTKFITTRFGNVLGSNGSVVPLFEKQIQRGGPVTVTHKEVTRYFMTIPEACQLVLEAGFMGRGGEIYVFDMGKPVRIYDLASKMILLSGFVPGKDIQIEVTGLRPGEKLYEELLDNREELLPTYNNKIMIARVREHDEELVNIQVNGILNLVDEKNCFQLVSQIKSVVPEFVPMNSFYSKYIQDPEPAGLLLKVVDMLKKFPVKDILIHEVKTPRVVTQPTYVNSTWQLNQQEFAMQVEGIGSFYACNGREIEYAPVPGALPQMVELYLYGSVYGAILHQRKILPLHGSSFIWNEQGVTLCGESGAGKSAITASFCMNGAKFLTDDVTPIDFEGGIPGIMPLSDRIKLWHDTLQQLKQEKSELAAVYPGNEKFYLPMEKSMQEKYPLKWLFIIEPSGVSEIEADVLQGVDSFTAIRNEVYRWEFLPAMHETETSYFGKLLDICRTIHVVKVKRPFDIPIENMIGFLQTQMATAS